MDILYLGPNSGTSKHRANALIRLGHKIKFIDPDSFLPDNRWFHQWKWTTGGLFLEKYIRNQVILNIGKDRFDLVLVTAGYLVGPALVKDLKKHANAVVNYNNDDPFNGRDRNLWRLYLKAIPDYDLLVVLRDSNVAEAYALGAKKVLRVFMSADEVAHHPRTLTDGDYKKWASEVLFVGTWMPERGPFMAALIEAGLPLTIYGDHWRKAKEWPILRQACKGRPLYVEDDYAKAIQSAKICLGLLSKGNRDLHTQRSLEIPLLGGLLSAERTTEHLELYQEGEEAVFWSDTAECINICQTLLHDEDRRKAIAIRGRSRCLQNNHLNEAIMSKIISTIT